MTKEEKRENRNASGKEQKAYYAVIPANVRYDKRLKANEKLLYGEITALTNERGYCWAGNKYFSELYGVTPQAVSKWISGLKECGYISIDYTYKSGTREIENRIIRLVLTNDCRVLTNVSEVSTNDYGGYKQMIKDNNTYINNTINNTNEYMGLNNNTPKKPEKKERFKAPTFEEVQEYCRERKNNIDAQHFIDYYSARGWMLGKNKIKDWRACVRTWERNDNFKAQKPVKPENVTTDKIDYSLPQDFIDMMEGK